MKKLLLVIALFLMKNAVADSIHHKKILVMSAAGREVSSLENTKFKEMTDFSREKCPSPDFIRISLQKGAAWGRDNTSDLDFLRQKIVEKGGFKQSQVFSAPGEVPLDYLRRNDLIDLTRKIKKPAIIEMFCDF